MSVPARVLVTGARGFLGRHVVAELLRRFKGTEIIAVSRRPPTADDHPGPALDLCKVAAWRELGDGYEWILHLAARIPSSNRASVDNELYEANVLPSRHLLA